MSKIYQNSSWLLLLLLFPFTISAQKVDVDLLKNMKPRNIGPGGMSGRVTAIDVITNQPNVIYAGTASGGLWKSESGGTDWKPVFDSVNYLSIGAVAINQQNPDEVWAGTGEGNPRNSVTGGYGLYKSIDGGKNWMAVGLEKTRNIHRIIINKTDSKTVYVGAIGSSWGAHEERGVFKTTDGGKTWKKILYVNDRTGVADMVVDPINPNKILVSMWEHNRQPWTFASGGKGSGLYITYDGGDNWKRVSDKDGFPKGELGRIGLAIAPSDPSRIYALVEAKKNAFYRSDDGGTTWKMINNKAEIGNRPFYYSDIVVDPKNENRIYSVYTYINRSEDGGKSFSRWANSYVLRGIHPDHHAFWIHPEDPKFIINGNDGGLNITRDGGKTWRFAENIPVAQFYHIAVDNEIPYNVYGGMQDNGSWAGPAYVFKSGGIRNSYWQELAFGDGFDVVPDLSDSRYGFAMSQQGYVSRYDKQTGHTQFVRPTHPDPDMKLRFNWNSAIAQDPFDNNTVYFGSQFVHKSTDKGNTWEVISPDLTTNDSTKQLQHESGGITMDATGAENHTTILAIESSKTDKGTLWASSDDGLIHLTRDGGKNWENKTPNLSGFPKGAWIPQIRTSKHNAAEAYVVVNDYRRFNFKPYLFHTKDFGKNWTNLLANQPDTIGYVLSFIQDPIEPKLQFLGTEHGLYFSIDEGANWTKWGRTFPAVSTMDLAIQEREHDLVIGTFGRAAWVLDDIRPLRALAKNGTKQLEKTVSVFPAPDAYLASNQQASGTRFIGNAIYAGENRSRGARISFSVFKEERKEEGEKKKKGRKNLSDVKSKVEEELSKSDSTNSKVKSDSIYLDIYNAENELIRSLKYKYKENGIQRVVWRMDEKGISFPSRKTRKRKSEPSGAQVLPGEYKFVVTFMDKKDSSSIKVLADPRVNYETTTLQTQYTAYKKLESELEVANKAIEALKNANKLMKATSADMKGKKGEEYDSLKSVTKSTQKEVKKLMDEFLGEEIKKQGIVRSPKPNILSFYYEPMNYLGSSLKPVGATETRLMNQASAKMTPWLAKVNAFFSTDWAVYQKLVEETDLSKFEKVEEFGLEK
jgi:photosystem II stability/assembly factor-like uncharacterized protein